MSRPGPVSLSGPLFVVAFSCCVLQILSSKGFGPGIGWESVAIAKQLALTGDYANPFRAGPSGPTAVIPPLFPLWLSVLFRVFPERPAFNLAAAFAAVLAQCLHASLLPAVAQRVFRSEIPGIFAGLLSAFAFRLMPQWDAVFTATGILLFVVCSKACTWRGSAAAGLCAGVLLLGNASSILVTAPWIAYLCRMEKVSLLRRGAVFVAAASLVVLPWMIRNQIQLGSFTLKDNFGMTAYSSNNDCASAAIATDIQNGCYDSMHPNSSARELALLTKLGECGYDRLRTADTLRWVRSNPAKFARLTAARFREFWFPSLIPMNVFTLVIWLATGLSLPGLALLLQRQHPVSGYLLAVLSIYPLMYYVVVSDVRYRYPVLWITLLPAGYFLTELCGTIRSIVPIVRLTKRSASSFE